MNRKYRFYYRRALKQSCKAIIGNKGHFKYYFYLILEFLAKLTVVFAPLFELSKIAFAKEIKNNGKADPLKALSSSNKFKSYWALVLSYVLQGLIFLAGLIMFVLFTAALALFGAGIASVSSRMQPATCAILFAIPGVIAILLYCIAFPILFAPVTYVIETNPDMGYGKAIALSFKAMKEKGFFTYLACLIWPTMINVAFIVLKALIAGGLILLSRSLGNFMILFLIIAGFVIVSELIYFLPIYDLTTKVAHVWLFEDIIEKEDAPEVVHTTRGVYVKDFQSNKVGINNIKNNLIRLFDNTDDLENELKEEVKPTKEEVQQVEEVKEEAVEQQEVEQQPQEEQSVEEIVEETQVDEQPVEEVVEETQVEEQPVEEVVEETQAEEQPVEEEKEEVVEQAQEEQKEENLEEKSANQEEVNIEQEVVEQPVEEEATTKKSRRAKAKKEEKEPKEKKPRKSLFKRGKSKEEALEETNENQEEVETNEVSNENQEVEQPQAVEQQVEEVKQEEVVEQPLEEQPEAVDEQEEKEEVLDEVVEQNEEEVKQPLEEETSSQ